MLIVIVPALVFVQPVADVPSIVSVTVVAVVVVGAVYTIGLPVEALNEPEEAVHEYVLAPFPVSVAVVLLQIVALLDTALTVGIGSTVKVILVERELQPTVFVPVTLSVSVVVTETDGAV